MEKEKSISNVCSKSSYICGDDCLLASYLRITRPELATEIDNQLILDNGIQIRKLARDLFKEHITIPYSHDKEKMVDETLKQIEKGRKIICEASFMKYNMFASIDILVFNRNSSVNLYMVKSSTKQKNIFLKELAFQKYLLECCGFRVNYANLITINKKYTRKKKINIHKYFTITDVTKKVSTLEKDVVVFMDKLNYLLLVQKETPQKIISSHCNVPYICPFQTYCMKEV